LQASQLKSFIKRKSDGSQDRFVAFLLPFDNQIGVGIGNESDKTDNDGEASVSIQADQLLGDYEWIREYDSQVRFDERGQTYLFRIGDDYIGYSDLNTKVGLRKRKRTSREDEGDGDRFLQPEKFILEFPTPEKEEEVEEGQQQQQQQQQLGEGEVHGIDEPSHAPADDLQQHDRDHNEGQREDGKMAFTYERAANRLVATTMKNVFGSDDEDEDE
jgi:hypothetical protein